MQKLVSAYLNVVVSMKTKSPIFLNGLRIWGGFHVRPFCNIWQWSKIISKITPTVVAILLLNFCSEVYADYPATIKWDTSGTCIGSGTLKESFDDACAILANYYSECYVSVPAAGYNYCPDRTAPGFSGSPFMTVVTSTGQTLVNNGAGPPRQYFCGSTPSMYNSPTCPGAAPISCSVGMANLGNPLTWTGADGVFQWECPASEILESKNFPCKECQKAGNPISVGTSNKFQIEPDYRSGILAFSRFYNSRALNFDKGIGAKWSHSFSKKIGFISGTNPIAIALRDDGQILQFRLVANSWISDGDIRDVLTRLTDVNGNPTGWSLTTAAEQQTEVYDNSGRVVQITALNGQALTMVYSDGTGAGPAGALVLTSAGATLTPSHPIAAGLLISVFDSFGKVLQFGYDSNQRLVKVTDPNGGTFLYGYDSATGNLISVTYPDGKIRQYVYNEAVYTANTNQPYALTGIVDEDNKRFATFYFDAQGRGISTEHSGGVEKYQLSYPVLNSQSSVTDPLGTTRTYSFSTIQGSIRSTGMVQPCGTAGCTGTVSNAITYDANGNVSSRIDFNGNKSCYDYDLTRNLEQTRIEGLSASAVCSTQLAASNQPSPACKITTTWWPTYRLPWTITEPTAVGNRVTTFGYDSSGNMLSKQVVVNGFTRTWGWTYDSYGRILTATDARGKVTTNTYYPNTAAQNTSLPNSRGMLASIANALGQTVNITSYNAHGQPLTIVDANGLTTTLTYDARQRLKTRTVGTELTQYDYYNTGLLKIVTLPDGSTLTYTYDDAHRLYQIQDGLGNKITYTLDNMGNRKVESYYDPANVLARTRTHNYDALNRLYQDIGGYDPAHQITQYSYDDNRNLKTITDPLAHITTQNYDALNRLRQVIDPFNGANTPTKYDYDDQDNLTQVTDPKNLVTTYGYNGFNEMETQISPDTGTTGFTYDAAGNLHTKTDARGVTATYTYDDLNRVATISYPAYQTDPAELVSYTYDSCTNGKGRLCSLSDKTGTTTWGYDLQGRILSKAQTVGGVTQTIGYHYNAAGQMDTMTLPSGKVVAYSYLNNRVTGVTVDGQPVVKNADYEPFGPIGDWTWGNDSTANPNKHIRYFDLDGRNTKIASGAAIDPAIIVYDAASRITALQRLTGSTVDPAKSNTYGYDNLDRLTAVTPNTGNPNPPRSYSYDGIGNRLTDTLASATTTYNYTTPLTTQQLQSLSGATAKTFGYDAVGNKISDGVQSWSYGGNNRPTTISISGAPLTTIQAGINALGQRVTKTVNGVITRFVYDEQGKLIGEYAADGTRIREHLWFNDLPVGVLK